ncbi:MAG: Gfo/Idh/MocA family oxidoreductase [Bacteroidetes bacterium]|jgi:predicted dehydrogenase|nr:Gfo/Idh/MocA family oxidoreductase [Bacteroidota bacterium]
MTNRIALIGLGYLGKIHLKLLNEHADWQLAGIYDSNKQLTRDLAEQYNLKAFQSLEEAFENADVVDIATPCNTHFEIAKQAIMQGRHVFTENPVTSTLNEAKQLQLLINEAGICFEVGSVERFNPAFISAAPFVSNPRFIEIHRLASYNSRGTDVSVVLDLMMHDLDLVLNIVKSNVRRISANGATLVSRSADIANARIEFDNGCVANITTNRMALKNTRKFRVFTESNFVTVNLLDKVTQVATLKNSGLNSKNMVIDSPPGMPKKELVFEHPIILPTNAINEQLSAFYKVINSGKSMRSSIADSIKVLELAFEIESRMGA